MVWLARNIAALTSLVISCECMPCRHSMQTKARPKAALSITVDKSLNSTMIYFNVFALDPPESFTVLPHTKRMLN